MVRVQCDKCGKMHCNCYSTTAIMCSTNAAYEKPKDIRDLEHENSILRKELAAAKAELFRLRNQRRAR